MEQYIKLVYMLNNLYIYNSNMIRVFVVIGNEQITTVQHIGTDL